MDLLAAVCHELSLLHHWPPNVVGSGPFLTYMSHGRDICEERSCNIPWNYLPWSHTSSLPVLKGVWQGLVGLGISNQFKPYTKFSYMTFITNGLQESYKSSQLSETAIHYIEVKTSQQIGRNWNRDCYHYLVDLSFSPYFHIHFFYHQYIWNTINTYLVHRNFNVRLPRPSLTCKTYLHCDTLLMVLWFYAQVEYFNCNH